jgi:hypothetical protein
MTNLQKLFRINNQLTSEQREAFEDYFVGALSVLADQTAWEKALACATRNVEAHNRIAVDRKELECQRCTEWPCICGNTDFEAENNMALRQAEEIE